MKALNFTPLRKALSSLSSALESTADEGFMSSLTAMQQRTMRAGAIQNFEFSYELCWKMLKRQLIAEDGEENINVLSRRDLFRRGAQKQLLDNPENWFVYHQARNETSHTYDEEKAEEVYGITQEFLVSAEYLLACLDKRQQ